jgi:hypothetical protein
MLGLDPEISCRTVAGSKTRILKPEIVRLNETFFTRQMAGLDPAICRGK